MNRRGWARVPRAFTLLELLIVVMVVLIMTSMAAVGLTSQIPKMKLSTQATVVLKLLRSAKERASADKKAWKVRFHQSKRVNTPTDLFLPDAQVPPVNGEPIGYGVHQLVFAAPIDAWYKPNPPVDVSPTNYFPSLLKNNSPYYNYDAGLPVGISIVPILYLTDASANPPGEQFPTELASLRLAGVLELEQDVRITYVNGNSTCPGFAPIPPLPCNNCYGDFPYDQPIPKNPNTNPHAGYPLRPSPSSPAGLIFDDRIADATYSPDGYFAFQPVRAPGNTLDYTIRFENLSSATYSAGLGPSTVDDVSMTITLDRQTGFPHF